jgi:hypothetical protein
MFNITTDKNLTKVQALDVAYAMLVQILNGKQYSLFEYHDKILAIEKAIARRD